MYFKEKGINEAISSAEPNSNIWSYVKAHSSSSLCETGRGKLLLQPKVFDFLRNRQEEGTQSIIWSQAWKNVI